MPLSPDNFPCKPGEAAKREDRWNELRPTLPTRGARARTLRSPYD